MNLIKLVLTEGYTIQKLKREIFSLNLNEITHIASWLGMIFVVSLIEGMTYGLVFGFNLDLVILTLIIFSFFYSKKELLILIVITWLLYPLFAAPGAQMWIWVNPLSWVIEYLFVYLLVIPFSLIYKGNEKGERKLKLIIYTIVFYQLKLLLHLFAGIFIWGSTNMFEAFLFNVGYVYFNLGFILITTQLIEFSLHKISLKKNWEYK